MDSETFFSIVLPEQGLRCIAVPGRERGYRHSFVEDNATAAALVQRLDAAGHNVFFGLAGFTDQALDKERDAKGKLVRGGRKQANVGWLRAYWADLDCGEGKPYATAADAAQGLKEFLRLSGLPKPWIVSSGRGLHVYWPLEADVARAEWKPVAVMLKQAFGIAGLKADPARTADEASVLRPVGSHHRKAEPRPVALLREGEVWPFEDFRAQVKAFLDANGVAPETTRTEPRLNADLMGGIEYPPTNADKIADRCAVLGMVRETRGNVDQPTWFRALGIIAFCEDGDRIAHEWSSGHPDYTPEETAAKLEQVRQFKPTTCAKLRECQPDLCAACPLNGEIASPIRLGFEEAEIPITRPADEIEVPSAAPATGDAQQRPARQPVILPERFRWAPWNGRMCLQIARDKDKDKDKGEDKGNAWSPFCYTLFYPVARLGSDDGYTMEIEMHVRTDANGDPLEVRRFTIPNRLVGEGGRSLAAALANYEIAPISTWQRADMDAYLNAWITKLKNDAEETRMFHHYGWHGDSFLVGEHLVTPNGTIKRARLRDIAHQIRGALEPKGDLEVWKAIIDRAYNHPGQEHWQFQVLCAFAAPLFALFQTHGGVTVYAHSDASGVGKTTAQRAALSVWGDWRELQLSEDKVTANMLWGFLGCYHNLPVLYDELTNMQDNVAAKLVFSVSSGRQRERMTPSGNRRGNNANWSTIMLASGNRPLTEMLANHRANSEAEMVRTFEFTCPGGSPLTVAEANSLFARLVDNYGHAGIVFARYLVRNRSRIMPWLESVREGLDREAGVRQSERYWSVLLTSVLCALHICRKLDLLRFDVAALKAWMFDRLVENRVHCDAAISSPLEVFGRMLADLWPGILVTEGEGNLRKNRPAMLVAKPHGPMVGRAILPDADDRKHNRPGVLFLNLAAVREWAGKRNASVKEMHKALVARGWASPNLVKYSLGRGTAEWGAISSQVTCWSIDLSRVMGSNGHVNVTDHLRVIPGGLSEESEHGQAATTR